MSEIKTYKNFFRACSKFWEPKCSKNGMYNDLMVIIISQNVSFNVVISIKSSIHKLFKTNSITFEMVNDKNDKLLECGVSKEKLAVMRKIPEFFLPTHLYKIPEISSWALKKFLLYTYGGLITDIVFFEDKLLLRNLSIVTSRILNEEDVKLIFTQLFTGCESMASVFFRSLSNKGCMKLKNGDFLLSREDFIS